MDASYLQPLDRLHEGQPGLRSLLREAWDNRYNGGSHWGAKAERVRTKPSNWAKPLNWDKKAAQKGIRYRVFCASLADVFDNQVSVDWRDDLWELIRKTPNLDWLLLTKRPQNIRKMLPDDWGSGYPNVWLGTTVESQNEARKRIYPLLKAPAKVHFLSCEPLLSMLDLRNIDLDGDSYLDALVASTWREVWEAGWKGTTESHQEDVEGFCDFYDCDESKIDSDALMYNPVSWVIAGGESGPDFRKTEDDWFRSLRDQCKDAGVPFLFKQYSGATQPAIKAKGRALDGVVHDGYPA